MCTRNNAKLDLLYCDTDGVQVLITYDKIEDPRAPTPCLYKHLFQDIQHYDFHEYPLSHPFYTGLNPEELKIALKFRELNKKKMLCFSDEVTDSFIIEMVSIRAKSYSMKTTKKEVKKCGGITITDRMTDFTFETYKKIAFREKIEHFTKQKRICSSKHEVMLKTIFKKSLEAFDNKFFLCKDGITALPYGHKDIPSILANWSST